MAHQSTDEATHPLVPYLAFCPWDIERWQNSRAFRRMSLAAQGAYLNLCLSAWKAQPGCWLPADDRELWRLANARSIEEWLGVKAEVFDSDGWAWDPVRGWIQEVVLETYQESARKHAAAVRSGRIAGKASARVRRAMAQQTRNKEDRTAVERPLNGRQPAVAVAVAVAGKEPPLSPPADAGGSDGGSDAFHPLDLGARDEPDEAERPPAEPGENDATPRGNRVERDRIRALTEKARQLCIEQGYKAWRPARRTFMEWAKAGLGWDEIRERILRGDHLPRVPL